MDRLLLIFVKHPVEGEVKTRLAAEIGHPKALAAYTRLLAHTRQVAEGAGCDKAVWYGNAIPPADLWSEAGWLRLPQQGADLGARMEHAFQWGFAQGYRRILIIGSDCGELRPEHLETAFRQLDVCEAVLGPAADGGYYLLGLRQMAAAVFTGKAWSTDQVFQATLDDLHAAGLHTHLLPQLSDVDTAADLARVFPDAL
jgi:hypothetical protein